MKSSGNNFFKYIFILVVIALIAGAIYIVYDKNKPNEENDEDVENAVQNNNVSIVENLKMGITNYDTMNPILTKNREIVNIDKLVFDSLINITSDYKAEYSLATACTKVSDTQYEIKVNTGIKWQDGSSLIAKDVQYTINKIQETGSIYMQNIQKIVNVETPDSETVIINLSEAVPYFEYNLTFPIISSTYYLNEDFQSTGKIPIGTGMYKIASIDNDNILLIRNDRWRNIKSNPPKTQSITIHKYNAIGEIFNAFKLGNIDVVNTYMTDYTNYVGTMGYNKKEYAGRDYDFISMNCKDSILSDSAVRKALNYGINKENIVSTVFGNSKIVADTPLDYGSYLNNAEGKISYNQEEAKKTLENGGWTYVSGRWQKNIGGYVRKLTLSLVVNKNNNDRVKVANNIKSQLADIGVIINIVQVDDNKYYEYLNNKNYQIILTGVKSSVNPDMTYFYGYNNLANYQNDDVQSKLNSLDNYGEIQKKVNEDVPYIGLYRNKGVIILNSNVGGDFSPNTFDLYYNFDRWFRQQ